MKKRFLVSVFLIFILSLVVACTVYPVIGNARYYIVTSNNRPNYFTNNYTEGIGVLTLHGYYEYRSSTYHPEDITITDVKSIIDRTLVP